MSLDYVKKGESVKASTVNSLIDAIGGNQRMSPDLNVTTTKNGPQVSLPSNYGGPNHKPNELLDVGRYQLSGWPMTQLFLGPEIDDCLNAIRLHKPDGTVQTSVSAAIVFKNSANCPTGGDLSGYLLSSEQFGYDRERHASGWLQTMLEDPYCGNYMGAQLWQYEDGKKLATIFTNVESDLSVKNALSSLLQNGGADSEGLSSIEKIDAWQLVDSTFLSAEISGQTRWISTHEHVKNHGQIDVYQSEGQDYKVVLKCSLKCVGVQESEPDPQTGETHVESTKWAWSIPLGPDATSDDGKAHSTCVTYGGNPVLFEVEEGEVGDDYDGTATYDNGEITFGLFEAEAGSPIDPGELWLVLKYDYEKKAVMGEFSDTTDSGSYTQDGILSRNVFVISGEEFTPSTDETQVGTKASIDILTYGTWGVLPKDGPKLDTYCKRDSETEFKSLDWADLEGEDVECQCAEIYKFDQLDFMDDPLSTDHIIVRRPDENGDGAEVKYVPLSSVSSGLVISGDTNYNDDVFKQKSIHTIELSGKTFHQLYKMDKPGMDEHLKVSFTPGPHDGLSCLLPGPDLSGNQLEFVVRRNGAGGEIDYAMIDLSASLSAISSSISSTIATQIAESAISGDVNNNDNEFTQKSIHTVELSGKTYHQLYKMDEDGHAISADIPTYFDPAKNPLDEITSNCEFVIRKGGPGGEIDYVDLSLRQAKLSVDRDAYAPQKSLQYANIDDKTFLELNGFHADGTTKPKVTLTSQEKPLLPTDNEFLIRHKVNGAWQLEYAPLSVNISGDTLVDSQVLRNQKSLEYISGNDDDYIQLYHMDEEGEFTEDVDLKFAKDSFQSLLPDDEEFVIRTEPGGQIIYKNVAVCLSSYLSGVANISGDTETIQTQKSIEIKHSANDGPDYYQLRGMDLAGTTLPKKTITLSSEGYTPLLPSNYEFVVRKNGAGGEIEYANLSCCIPDLSALSGTTISGDTNVVQNYQSIETKDDGSGNKYHEIYNFQDGCAQRYDSNVRFWDPYDSLSAEEGLGCGAEFLVRRSNANGGYSISYEKIVALQEHEKLDSQQWDPSPRGYSLDYTAYDHGYGCEQVMQLWGFDWGCSHFITSSDISSYSGNGILIRKWDDYGCCWVLDYMNFDSLDELAKKYIGDSQLSLSAHNPYRKSVDIYWDYDDNKYYVELWGFQTDYRTASVTIRNDGCTYYWPQDVRTDHSLSEWDYILVKHVDANGNHTLQYKQLEVEMPDISGIEGDINNIYGDINNFYDEINYLSVCIDDLSGHLSGGYWESGGDSGTCYGSNIADSNQIIVIDLDNHALEGNWDCNGTFYADYFDVGCQISLGNTTIGHNNIHVDGQIDFVGGCTYLTNGYFYVDGTVYAGCGFYTGCAYLDPSTLQVGCSISIGCTSINESQLSALLQLAAQAPQLLQNL